MLCDNDGLDRADALHWRWWLLAACGKRCREHRTGDCFPRVHCIPPAVDRARLPAHFPHRRSALQRSRRRGNGWGNRKAGSLLREPRNRELAAARRRGGGAGILEVPRFRPALSIRTTRVGEKIERLDAVHFDVLGLRISCYRSARAAGRRAIEHSHAAWRGESPPPQAG